MKNEPMIDPRHEQIRGVLRGVGPVLLVVGVIFSAIGFISFFSSFGTFEPPRYFWCVFVGFPLIGIGTALSKAGYLGAMLRYMSGEMSPVGKDTFNYMAEGTRPGVETIARAVGEGLGAAQGGRALSCPKCQAPNDPSAQFCDQCGAPVVEVTCPSCQRPNAPGSRFCSHCGRPIG
jgi:hypothetical protein